MLSINPISHIQKPFVHMTVRLHPTNGVFHAVGPLHPPAATDVLDKL